MNADLDSHPLRRTGLVPASVVPQAGSATAATQEGSLPVKALAILSISLVLISYPAYSSGRPDPPQGGNNQSSRPADLIPRILPTKPLHAQVPLGYDPQRIEVKFRDDLPLAMGKEGYPIDLAGGSVNTALTRAVFEKIRALGGEWLKPALNEQRIDSMRIMGERNIGRKLADFNTNFLLKLPRKEDAVQIMDDLNGLESVELAVPQPLPMNPPIPDDYRPLQGYLNASPDGINASYAWAARAGGTGDQVRIVDLEYSWNLNHQDFPPITSVILPVEVFGVPQDPFDSNHGTAVLGVLVSRPNGYGTVGGAYDASMFVAPVSYTIYGYSLYWAILNSLQYLSPGDVMLIEQQMTGPNWPGGATQFGYVPVEWNLQNYNAIVQAVALGINVVEPAGNGSQNLDDPVYSQGNDGHWPFLVQNDSGAIMVGAGAAPPAFGGNNVDRSRLDGSNYGDRVNLQGWGQAVTTTGYGDYYKLEGPDLWYARGFNGTSSASAVVASAVALFESVYEAETSSIRPVLYLRQELMQTGSPQQAGTTNPVTQNIGPRPDVRAALCLWDWTLPSCTCPYPISVSCSEQGGTPASNPLIAAFLAGAAGQDACSGVEITNDAPSFFPVGQTEVTFTATDNHNNTGTCTSSVTVTNDPLPPPELVAPEDGAHCQSVSETVMSWSAVPSATMYQLQIGTIPETGAQIPLTTTSFSQDLESGTRYYWRVKTRNSCNTWGEYSPSWSFSTDPEPSAPPDLLTPPIMTSCLGTSGTLTWEDLGVEHGFYLVQIGTSCGTGATHLAPDPHYNYSGLAPGTIYYWRVASPGGTCGVPGTWSDCFFFATAPEVPLPPTLQWPLDGAQCRPMADTLSWAPPAGEGYISRYIVQLGTNCETGVVDTIAAVPRYSYSGLQPNTTYHWRVKTKGSCAYSDYTPCFSFKTGPAVPYLTSPGNGSMCMALADSLTWDAVSGATEYRVQLGASCGAGTEYDVSSPYYYSSGLAPGTKYFWRVKAKDAYGCYGSYSDCVSFSTAGSAGLPPPVLQSPPDEVKCMQVVPFLSLIWSDVPGAPGYKVQIGTSCGTGAEHDVSSHQYSFTGLAAGTTYYWRVKTRDCYGGYGDYSDCFSFATRPAGALASPGLQSPDDGATCQALRDTLRWTAVPGAGGYLVRFGTSDCPTYGAHHVTAAEYVADDLNPNTIYHWSVAAEDSCGTVGSYSACRWFRTDPQDLAHPTLQSPNDGATGQPQSLMLNWSDVSGATGYKVQIGTSCGTGSVHEVTASQYAASGLGSKTTYFWRVATKDNCNRYSDYSNCFHFETACDGIVLGPPALQSPTDGAMCQETSGILDWPDVPGATGYDVRLNTTSCGTTLPHFLVTESQYAYSGLTPGLTYFWQVATKNCASQYGSYSTPCFSFTTRVSAAVVKADGTGSYPTIQAAINAICIGGIIELANGTFVGTGNRDLDFQGKAITVRSQSGTPDSCIIDCQGSSGSPHRGFYFHTGEDSAAVVSGITIQHGYVTSPGGGAILIDGGSSPTIEDCVFAANASTSFGGAIVVQNGSQPTIEGCAFLANTAPNGGGLNNFYASPEVTGCEFRENTVTSQGGGIYNSHASSTVLNTTFIRNSAVYGGGMVNGPGSTPLVSGCTFFDNRASSAGGAIDDFGAGAGANVQRCIIAYGSVGAAVACGSGGAPVLSCCDVFGNAGGDWAGCIAGQGALRSNFSADPLFCSVDLVDLGLLPESPCAPANNPTCGLVGAKPVGCSAIPDLIVTSIQPDTALVGQSVWVVIHVKNQGGAAAGASKASVRVDEVLKCAEVNIPAIAAGQTVASECGVGVLTEGGHLVQVCTDVTELVSELSENNNCKTEPLVVRQQTDVEGSVLPAATGLVSVVPNPFTGTTTIHYGMAKAGAVRLEVFDPAGRRVAGLLVGVASQGMQAIDWDGRTDGGTHAASGIYYLRFTAEGQVWTRALVLLR
jgi:serine protease